MLYVVVAIVQNISLSQPSDMAFPLLKYLDLKRNLKFAYFFSYAEDYDNNISTP